MIISTFIANIFFTVSDKVSPLETDDRLAEKNLLYQQKIFFLQVRKKLGSSAIFKK